MGIGDIADQLGISIEDVQKWETLDSVPQEAIDLYEFEKENQIIEDLVIKIQTFEIRLIDQQ